MTDPTRPIEIHTLEDIEKNLEKVREAARLAHEWIAKQSDNPMDFLRSVKFEKKGFHPITHHPLNLIEQINQTWTYAVALRASQILLERHPEACGLKLAPGATACQELDIMSIKQGFLGAETFAATSPASNQKIRKDIEKMKSKEALYLHRYVFFTSPTHPHTERQVKFEKGCSSIEVWSLDGRKLFT